MNTVKEEESLTADSGKSTAGEDDFNPFGNICLVAQTRQKEAKGRENGCRFRPFI